MGIFTKEPETFPKLEKPKQVRGCITLDKNINYTGQIKEVDCEGYIINGDIRIHKANVEFDVNLNSAVAKNICVSNSEIALSARLWEISGDRKPSSAVCLANVNANLILLRDNYIWSSVDLRGAVFSSAVLRGRIDGDLYLDGARPKKYILIRDLTVAENAYSPSGSAYFTSDLQGKIDSECRNIKAKRFFLDNKIIKLKQLKKELGF